MELKVLQDNPCLANKDKCNLMCCKIVSFKFSQKPREDLVSVSFRHNAELTHYLTLHEGIKASRNRMVTVVKISPELKRRVIQTSEGWSIVIFTKCKALTEEGNCRLYGTKARPRVCEEGYTIRKKGVLFVPGCIYTPDADSVVLKEEDLK